MANDSPGTCLAHKYSVSLAMLFIMIARFLSLTASLDMGRQILIIMYMYMYNY